MLANIPSPLRASAIASALLFLSLGAAAQQTAPSVESVVVNGTLDQDRERIAPALGAVVHTIGPEAIAAIPQGSDAAFSQVLLRAPGVVADSLGEVHVRGEHGDLTYRLNGILLPEGLNGFGQEIDTRLIDNVKLIDGTLPAQFGFRTAGIVDIKTKSGAEFDGTDIGLSGGGFNTIQPSVSTGGMASNIGYFVTASYKHNHLGIENPAASLTPLHDTTDQLKLFSYLSYEIDDARRVSLLLSASDAQFQIPDTPGLVPQFILAGFAQPNSATVNERQNEQNYYAVASYQETDGPVSFQGSLYTRYGQIRFTPDNSQDLVFQGLAGRELNSFFTNGTQFDLSWRLGAPHTIRAGFIADYTREALNTNTLVFATAPSGAQLSTSPSRIADDTTQRGLTAGIYAQDEWKLTPDLTLNFGARYDRFDTSFDHEGQLSPRANLVWNLDDTLTVHAGYAQYFTPPSIQYVPSSTLARFAGTSNAPANFADDPPHVERADYFDAGFSKAMTDDWTITGDGFLKQARNLLDLGQFGSAVILSPFSYRVGRVIGAEFGSNFTKGPLTLFANFSYVKTSARDINSAQFEFEPDELAYIQTHNIELDHEGRYALSAGASYQWGDIARFYTDVIYGYGLRKGFANTEKLPEYYPVNVGIEHIEELSGPIKSLTLRLDCINIADEVYRLRDGSGLGISASQYGQRRTILASVTGHL